MQNTFSCSSYSFPQEENSSLPQDFQHLTEKLFKLSEKHMYLPATSVIYCKSSTTPDYSHEGYLKYLVTFFNKNELNTTLYEVCSNCCHHCSEKQGKFQPFSSKKN